MTVYTGRNFSTKIVSGNVTVSLMSYPRKPSDLPSLHMLKKDIMEKKTVIICFLLNMKHIWFAQFFTLLLLLVHSGIWVLFFIYLMDNSHPLSFY